MAISHKRKRKIIFKEKLYFWYVIKDDDYEYYDLKIISDDKKIQLSYEVNQMSDCFLHPKICVLKSEKLKEGVYHFSPPIADAIISNHNVGAILNWYDNQEKTVNPIVFKMPQNPLENINFKSGIVTYIKNDFSRINLKEDVLHVSYPKNYLLNVGWYGSMDGYIIAIIRNNDLENPLAKTHKSYFNLQEAITSAVDIIEKQINE